jgi:hypothetical protein
VEVELYRRHQGRASVTIHTGGISLREISVTPRDGESGFFKIQRPYVVGPDGKSRACYTFSSEVWREIALRINELWLQTERAIRRGEPTPIAVKWSAE